mgnify:CR=1 FL=1
MLLQQITLVSDVFLFTKYHHFLLHESQEYDKLN